MMPGWAWQLPGCLPLCAHQGKTGPVEDCKLHPACKGSNERAHVAHAQEGNSGLQGELKWESKGQCECGEGRREEVQEEALF